MTAPSAARESLRAARPARRDGLCRLGTMTHPVLRGVPRWGVQEARCNSRDECRDASFLIDWFPRGRTEEVLLAREYPDLVRSAFMKRPEFKTQAATLLALALGSTILVAPRRSLAFVAPNDGGDGDGAYYLNAAIVNDDKLANAMTLDLDTFKSAVTDGKAIELLNIAPAGFGVSLRFDSSQVVIACFSKKTGQPKIASFCGVAALRIRGGSVEVNKDHDPSEFVKTFMSNGTSAISGLKLRTDAGLTNGDVITLVPDPLPNEPPQRSFSARNYVPSNLSGTAGFRIPFAAYGGAFTPKGLSFSLLAPAFSWGGQWNHLNRDYDHTGLGLLIAPALAETKITSTDPGGKDVAGSFTLTKLAVGAFVDFGGYVWLGGGARFDFSADHNHAGLVFLVLGPSAYSKLFGR